MGEVEKPFSCPQPGCGRSFANEDRLVVHRHSHRASLTSGEQLTPPILKNSAFVVDETPPPTRGFWHHCEEVSLFQDLNPFDEQFRRASQSHYRASSESLVVTTENSSGSALVTPDVLPVVDETISSTSRDDSHISACALSSAGHSSSVVHSNTVSSTQLYTPKSSPQSLRCLELEEQEKQEGKDRLTLNVSCAAEAALSSSSIISTPTPVITAGPSVTQSLGSLGGTCCSACSTAAVSKSDSSTTTNSGDYVPVTSQPVGSSSFVTTAAAGVEALVSVTGSHAALQLMLRLPNGQAMPVEIPATPIVSTSSSSLVMTTVSSSHSALSSPVQTSLAKMRLKEALASSATAARPGTSRNSRANTADRIAEMTRNRNASGTLISETGPSEPNTNSMCLISSNSCGSSGPSSGRRRRNSSGDEDQAEKRQKFLARNRAAAIRCREKKKKWVQNLAQKSEELTALNQKLQSEVASLRKEVAVLKGMLLQHKDCPVTKAMQDVPANGQETHDHVAAANFLDSLLKKPRPALPSIAGHKPLAQTFSLPSIISSVSSSTSPPSSPSVDHLEDLVDDSTNDTHLRSRDDISNDHIPSSSPGLHAYSVMPPVPQSSISLPVRLQSGSTVTTPSVTSTRLKVASVISTGTASKRLLLGSSPAVTQIDDAAVVSGSSPSCPESGLPKTVLLDTSKAALAVTSTRQLAATSQVPPVVHSVVTIPQVPKQKLLSLSRATELRTTLSEKKN